MIVDMNLKLLKMKLIPKTKKRRTEVKKIVHYPGPL